MAACEDLYREWMKRGNFCQKSDMTAKDIEEFIEYRLRYKLEASLINRSAMFPLRQIEDSKVLHLRCVKEIKKIVKKVGGRNVTRRLMIELINRENEKLPLDERIKYIPRVRSRMDGFQHEIGNISWETRELFDSLKPDIGARDNNEIMRVMLTYCKDNIEPVKALMEKLKQEKLVEAPEEPEPEDNKIVDDIRVVSSP